LLLLVLLFFSSLKPLSQHREKLGHRWFWYLFRSWCFENYTVRTRIFSVATRSCRDNIMNYNSTVSFRVPSTLLFDIITQFNAVQTDRLKSLLFSFMYVEKSFKEDSDYVPLNILIVTVFGILKATVFLYYKLQNYYLSNKRVFPLLLRVISWP
jgi:hypothetical protein